MIAHTLLRTLLHKFMMVFRTSPGDGCKRNRQKQSTPSLCHRPQRQDGPLIFLPLHHFYLAAVLAVLT